MHKKSYCILNKQYSKEEYEKLTARIVDDMTKRGEYGEFFPISSSPFGYNETIAQDFFPLTKEEVHKKGYHWQEAATGQFSKETLKPESIPDHIKDISDSILDKVLACMNCGKNYKIIPQELEFYRFMTLPIPRSCNDCRYKERLTFRNPRRLWHRQCMCDYKIYNNTSKHSYHSEGRCPNEFETTYAPERSEIVYCEPCYQQEVV